MQMDTGLLVLLIVQGVMGGIDTVLNHELVEHLRERRSARTEVGLHALREAIYAMVFLGLGWGIWHGVLAVLVAALLIAEFAISTVDEAVENRSRVLPQNERVLHAFLTLNLGCIFAVSALVLMEWAEQPSGLQLRTPDIFAFALTTLGLVSILWTARDLRGWRRLSLAATGRR
jgi:hypothetical protein